MLPPANDEAALVSGRWNKGPQRFHLTYRISFDDYAWFVASRRGATARWSRMLVNGLIGCFILLALLVGSLALADVLMRLATRPGRSEWIGDIVRVYPPHAPPWELRTITPFAIFGAGWCLLVIILRRLDRWRLRRIYLAQDFSKHPIEFHAFDEDFRADCGGHSSLVKWSVLHSVVVDEAYLLLLSRPALGYIVPRTAFPDEATWNAFISFVNERTGKEQVAGDELSHAPP